jgi:hypothetical protein
MKIKSLRMSRARCRYILFCLLGTVLVILSMQIDFKPTASKSLGVILATDEGLIQDYRNLERRFNFAQQHVEDQVNFSFYQFPIGDLERMRSAVTTAFNANHAILVATDILSFRELVAKGGSQRMLFEMNVNPLRNTPNLAGASGPFSAAGVVYLADIHELRFSLLKEMNPSIRNLGVIGDRHYLDLFEGHTGALAAAKKLNLNYHVFLADDVAALESLWIDPAVAIIDAWYVVPGDVMREKMSSIVSKINHLGKPSMYWRNQDVRAGGLMAVQEVSPDFDESMYRLLLMAHAGVNLAEIPLIKPIGSNAYLNVSTLNRMGLKLPPEVMVRFSAFYK